MVSSGRSTSPDDSALGSILKAGSSPRWSALDGTRAFSGESSLAQKAPRNATPLLAV